MMVRRTATMVIVGLLAVGALTACGGDDGPERVTSGPRDSAPADTKTGGGTDAGTDAEAYVGLTKAAATAKADAAEVTWRITREDDEEFMVTLDYDPQRLNFEIDDGRVTRATYG